MTDSQRRSFNQREKTALYLAADGKCESCGVELEPGWHADHREPYSKGGATDVINGQALCPTCNLKKGNRVSPTSLLAWQDEALRLYEAAGLPPRFLLAAVPGGGKTRAAAAASAMVGRFTVVLVPQEDLVSDWRTELHAWGVCPADLKKGKFGNSVAVGTTCPACGRPAASLVMTYAFSAANPQILSRIMRERGPILLVLDEVHHLRDGGAWLEPIKTAWPLAGDIKVLCLSGTPFRSDEESVPFIHTSDPYKESRALLPEDWTYDYSYGQGVTDKPPTVTKVIFERYSGDIEWLEQDENGVESERSARLGANHSREVARKVRRHALNPKGDWLRKVLRAANEKLDEVRSDGDPHAGALVVCMNTEHAIALADILAQIQNRPVFVYTQSYATRDHHVGGGALNERTGERAGHEDRVRLSTGSMGTVLDAYKEGDAAWIVTVRKVSEGVNVPRLRVLVYAAVTRTMLFFMQVLGRVIRIHRLLPSGVDQTAWVFIPDEEPMREYAAKIESGVSEALINEVLEEDDEDAAAPQDRTGGSRLRRDRFLRSDADYAGATYSGKMHDAEIMSIARRITAVSPAEAIQVVNQLADLGILRSSSPEEAAPDADPASPPRAEIDPVALKDQAATKMRSVAKSWAALRLNAGEFKHYNEAIQACNRELGQMFQVWASNADVSVERIEKATAWIKERIVNIKERRDRGDAHLF